MKSILELEPYMNEKYILALPLWARSGILFGLFGLILTSLSLFVVLRIPSVQLPNSLDAITWGFSLVTWGLIQMQFFPDHPLFFTDDTSLATPSLFPTAAGLIIVVLTTILFYFAIGAWLGTMIDMSRFRKQKVNSSS